MIHQLFKLLHPGRRNDLHPQQFIVQLQGEGRRQPMFFRQVTDQGAVRLVHQERPDDHAAQKLIPVDQRKRDMIQVGMAGKNVRLSDFLSALPRFPMQLKALRPFKHLLFQQGAIAGDRAKGGQQNPRVVNELNGNPGVSLQGT